MSSGKFSKSSYESEAGTFHKILVQPETLTTVPANPSAGTPPNSRFRAMVSATSRKKGVLIAAHMNISRTIASSDPNYNTVITDRIPLLTKATRAAMANRTQVTYLGLTWDINSIVGERVNL